MSTTKITLGLSAIVLTASLVTSIHYKNEVSRIDTLIENYRREKQRIELVHKHGEVLEDFYKKFTYIPENKEHYFIDQTVEAMQSIKPSEVTIPKYLTDTRDYNFLRFAGYSILSWLSGSVGFFACIIPFFSEIMKKEKS